MILESEGLSDGSNATAQALQHRQPARLIEVLPMGTGSHDNHEPEANHALTINVAQSD
ncbi:hypothetical protein [Nereida sp.]|uniref:hypothetical protein n=1 Tax=Nereida sp. TaxID=2736090 RepID=UPI003F699211